MQTIIIKLDSEKLINADLDMRYKVPDYIETYTDGVVTDNGYDYVNESGTELAIWLDTKDAAAQVQNVIHRLKPSAFAAMTYPRQHKYISQSRIAQNSKNAQRFPSRQIHQKSCICRITSKLSQ